MSTITSLGAADTGATSRGVINTNFTNLNTDKVETSVIDTDGTLAANSDAKVATQKAVKSYVDTTTAANDVSCFVYQNSAVAIGTDDNTALLFQLERFDTDTMHSTVTNTSRITFNTAGKYAVGGNLKSGLAETITVRIVVDGTTTLAGGYYSTLGSGGASVSTIYDFSAGQYIELYGDAGSAGYNTSGDISTNFWAYKIN